MAGTALESVDAPVAAADRWPWSAALLVTVLAVLYIPVVAGAYNLWMQDENYAHGIFIIPVTAWLLWMLRDRIRSQPARPTAWGLAPLMGGLLLETLGWLIGSRSLAMFSIILTLAGMVLVLWGRPVWELTRFPIVFLFFTVRLPVSVTNHVSQWAQRISTDGAVLLMKVMGFTVMQQGNLIQVPGMELEVADVCSGFKKLIALIAFSLLYGYLYRLSLPRWIALVVASIPIALAANIVRIAGLIAVASLGGEKPFHLVHNAAEMVVLVVAFFLFALVGKSLGCEKTRFSR